MKIFNKMDRTFWLCAVVSLSITLTSCTTLDPGYESLLANAETHNSSDAIVGMWHRRAAAEIPLVTGKIRMSLLFSRNGTGAAEAMVHNGIYYERLRSESDHFTWSYSGGGLWNMRFASKGKRVDECRISNGKLLRKYNGGTGFLIYEFVNP